MLVRSSLPSAVASASAAPSLVRGFKHRRDLLLDILLPAPIRNAILVPDALLSIVDNTNIPFRVVVVIDGGVRKDFESLETFLANFDHPWKLMHNNPAVGLNQTLREGLAECHEKITAIICPQVRLMDPGWFGKVQVIFQREPITGIVDTAPNTSSATLYPIRRAQNRPPLPGCRFMVVQTSFAQKTQPFGHVDPAEFWSRSASQQGGASWYTPGVKYAEVDCEQHELWRAPLGAHS